MMRDFHSDIGSIIVRFWALLRPILCRMRQRPFVILDPYQITGIKPSAALRNGNSFSASLNRGPMTCLPMTTPRGRSSSKLAIFI
jgi:hypothetical protein